MGKKVKKKGRSSQKEKHVLPNVSKATTQQSIPGIRSTIEGVSFTKEKRLCIHFDKSVDLVKVSTIFGTLESMKCEDCRAGVVDRKASKVKGKDGKKKGGGSVPSNLESKSLWICLKCGHFSCGGVGFPTVPQTHAVRHAKQNGHHVAIQFENPNLRWCFPCRTLMPAQILFVNGEQKDPLADLVKLFKVRPTIEPTLEGDCVPILSGNSASDMMNSENFILCGFEGRGGYIVRGLLNLGNTCFFNSVLQNLLAMDKVRKFFLKLNGAFGPLSSSFKKLFEETNTVDGARNIVNPKSFFSSVCAKAPQFRGFQQHDSHELLRCLLDGLSSEDSREKRGVSTSESGGDNPNLIPTFVDLLFGGQISSTVTCLECGHASVVHEPFLDLSLPLPTKKSPTKKTQPVSRAKKPKLPPKKNGKFRTKGSRNSDLSSSKESSAGDLETASACSGLVRAADESVSISQKLNECNVSKKMLENNVEVEKASVLSDSLAWMDYLEPVVAPSGPENSLVVRDISMVEDQLKEGESQNDEQNQPINSNELDPSDGSCPSVDYLEKNSLSDDCNAASKVDCSSLIQRSGESDVYFEDASLKPNSDSNNQLCAVNSEVKAGNGLNSWEEAPLLQVQESEILLLPYKEISLTDRENVTSSSIKCEQEPLDFVGFGGLFDEPEASAEPISKNLSNNISSEANSIAEADFSLKNSSDSDPDEVDNSNFPVSVESCLYYFTKAELLTKIEHAWQCEECSKNLSKPKNITSEKKMVNIAMESGMNGGENRVKNALLDSVKDCYIGLQNLYNGNFERKKIVYSGDDLVLQNGVSDGGQNCRINPESGHNQLVSESQGGQTAASFVPSELSQNSKSMKAFGESLIRQTSDESYGVNESCSINQSDDDETTSKGIKVARDATKQILVSKSPPILTIHLKRFSQDGRGRLSKLCGHVHFRDTLNLKPYMDPSCRESERHKYRLIGVVEHLGTMRGGHYVAYIRGGLRSSSKVERESKDFSWYHASDAHVHEVSFEEVLRSEAYILFYEELREDI